MLRRRSATERNACVAVTASPERHLSWLAGSRWAATRASDRRHRAAGCGLPASASRSPGRSAPAVADSAGRCAAPRRAPGRSAGRPSRPLATCGGRRSPASIRLSTTGPLGVATTTPISLSSAAPNEQQPVGHLQQHPRRRAQTPVPRALLPRRARTLGASVSSRTSSPPMPAVPCTGALRRKLPTGHPSKAGPPGHKSFSGARHKRNGAPGANRREPAAPLTPTRRFRSGAAFGVRWRAGIPETLWTVGTRASRPGRKAHNCHPSRGAGGVSPRRTTRVRPRTRTLNRASAFGETTR